VSPRTLDLTMTLGIVLEVLEILRRLPRRLLMAGAILLVSLLYLVYLRPWWTAAMLVALLVLRHFTREKRPGSA
jgi:hypothetical protein